MEIKNSLEDRKFFIDNRHYFPEYLLRYLKAFGIEQGYNPQIFIYRGETLDVRVDSKGAGFFSPKEGRNIAHIDFDGYEVFYEEKKDQSGIVVRKTYNYAGVQYHPLGGGDFEEFYSYGDRLGNVHIIYAGDVSKEIVVYVGEEKDTFENYILQLKEQINMDKEIDANVLKFLNIMIGDPRFVDGVKHYMKAMAPDIETAYENEVNRLKSFYGDQVQEQMKKIYAIQDNAIAELTHFRDELLAGKKSK